MVVKEGRLSQLKFDIFFVLFCCCLLFIVCCLLFVVCCLFGGVVVGRVVVVFIVAFCE